MSFKNICCLGYLTHTMADAQTGEDTTCPNCGNEFVHDGASWRPRLELGQRKVEKLHRIRLVNERHTAVTSAQPSPSMEF